MSLGKCDPKAIESCVAYKNKYREASHRLDEFILRETTKEKKALEIALKAYEDKVEAVSKTKEFQEIENQVLSYSNKYSHHLQKVIRAYQDVYNDVVNDTTLTKEQKATKMKKIFDYAYGKLIDKEEQKHFHNTTYAYIFHL